MNAATHALVVGAGIGGLAAALALAQKGLRVTVLEQSAAFSEVGAGIQISPNASRILYRLGLSDQLADCAFAPEAIEMRNWKTGDLIMGTELGTKAEKQFGAPYLNVHRADLHQLLVSAISDCDRVDIQLNARCEAISQTGNSAQARTGDGRHFAGDLLVGADGIKSCVRAALFGAEQPRFTGCVAWRGLIPSSAIRDYTIDPVATLWMGPRSHFVHYYVRGGRLVNFVAVTESDGWEVESWTERGEKSELTQAFQGWHAPVGAILAAADPAACYKWALFDRKPMSKWSSGAMTLLGDACHPTLPFMAQGACMAIEDAAVLAQCLDQSADIQEGLQRYETLRLRRTASVQRTSHLNKTLYHLQGPLATFRDTAFPMLAGLFAKRLEDLFGYDALSAR